MKETYKVSVEVFKYPYCGKSVESEKFLSEKICCSTIKVQKKIIKGIKWSIFYIELSVRLEQALAWKRLETGTHTQDDVTWIKHECAERHHELKYDSGYSEAHERAQSRYDGFPWENKF